MGALKRAVCDKLFKEFIWGRVQSALHQPPHMLAAVFEPPKLLYQWSLGETVPYFLQHNFEFSFSGWLWPVLLIGSKHHTPDAKIHRIKICHFENCIFNFTMLYLQKLCTYQHEILSTCCKISWLYMLRISSTYLKKWRSYIKNKKGMFFLAHPVYMKCK